MDKDPIALARGNGIGPEIMDVTLDILKAAGAELEIHEIAIGEEVYKAGHATGIEDTSWDTIRQCRAFLKAPITTPQGGGFKSLNVTIRTTMGLYANIRPCVSYHPFVSTKHPNMDVVIIRENEEDLYTGIEYRQTPETYQSLKINTRPGCEKIIDFAFKYAQMNGRKKVTCFSKDNILKITDGLFHRVFDEIAANYPEIENDHWIIDIGSAKLADAPEEFDVIVTANLYGDIISDIGAQICGSIGLAGTTNIGEHGAMFEAIHGSAPQIAGQDIANPSGLINAAVQMLVYLGQTQVAMQIHNALLCTIEEGVHTADIFSEEVSKEKVGTKDFGRALIERLGQTPKQLKPAHYEKKNSGSLKYARQKQPTTRKLVGIDIFMYAEPDAEAFKGKVTQIETKFNLEFISNRGTRIYPDGFPETFCVDHFRCRYLPTEIDATVKPEDLIELQKILIKAGCDIIKTENLYTFDDAPGFSHAKN
ncbi:MAG: NADP-dependent isocitrate dehydrogenase [Simkaniaceae bacterium]|nr:NADP-dependent isocitrate dehydrogenase [Simkaniaceae bacterium]